VHPSLRICASTQTEEGLRRVTKGARLCFADVRQLMQGAVPGYRHLLMSRTAVEPFVPLRQSAPSAIGERYRASLIGGSYGSDN
jgi:hypothetical protein